MFGSLPLLAALLSYAPSGEPPLVVYTTHERDLYAPVLDRFRAAEPGTNVEVVQLDPRTILERLRGERDGSALDAGQRRLGAVWWGGDAATFATAAKEGLLAPSSPTWARSLPPVARDPQGRWHAQFLAPLAIVYRRGAKELPQRWDDLIDARVRGRLLLRLPTDSNPMRVFLGAMIAQHAESRSDFVRGLDWVAMFESNRTGDYVTSSRDLLSRVADLRTPRGERDLTVWLASDAANRVAEDRIALDWVTPPGSPAMLDAAALLDGAPSPAAAARFIDFLGQDAHLAGYLARGRIPLPAERVDPAALAPWMASAITNGVAIDGALLAQRLDEWLVTLDRRLHPGARATEGEVTTGWLGSAVSLVGTAAMGIALVLLMRRQRSVPASGHPPGDGPAAT